MWPYTPLAFLRYHATCWIERVSTRGGHIQDSLRPSGSLTSHRFTCEELWDGTSGLSTLSEKTRRSNHLQMSLQRKHFLLSYLNPLSVRPGLEPTTSRTVVRHSTNRLGSRVGGESARLPPMCPGFDSRTRRHMWAEFVGSLLCSERFFSGYSGFPLSPKTSIWFDLVWLRIVKNLEL